MASGVPEEVERRAREVLAGLPGRDVNLFLARLRRWWHDLAEGLRGPYGDRHDLAAPREGTPTAATPFATTAPSTRGGAAWTT
jgi:hypothetical protein